MKSLFPKTGRQTLDGGLNTKFDKSIILDNESPDCLNVKFDAGSCGTRGGSTKLNTTAIGAFVGDGLYTRRDNSGSETMVAFAGGSAWQLGGTTFTTIPSAQSVFTAGARVGAAQFQNLIFIGNGGAIPYKYDGTSFTRHGVYPPSFVASAGTAGTGNALNGTYMYKFSFLNSALVESDVGSAVTFIAANQNAKLTSLPTAAQSWGIGSRVIYRTVAGGTAFKKVITISDNTTTTYEDGIADGSLGAAAPTDNGVPPKYNAIIYHQSRLFMNDPANPGFVWYTDITSGTPSPYTVPAATNFFRVGDNSSDVVKGFAVDNNNLLVFCEQSTTIVYMTDTTASNWKFVVSQSPYGSKSPYGAFKFDNKIGVPVVQSQKFVGFAAFMGGEIDRTSSILSVGSTVSDMKSNSIETDMFSIQESYLGNISSMVFKNRAYISVTYSGTTNNRIYVMDFTKGQRKQEIAWVPYTGWNAAQFTIYNGKLYFISATNTGFVYEAETSTYSDDGSAINSYVWTKETGGNPEHITWTKDFIKARFLVDMAGSYFMNFGWRTNSDKGTGDTKQINLDPGGNLWGTMLFGTSLWGGGTNQTQFNQDMATANGERIQLYFSNQNKANQRFKVHWHNIEYNTKGLR